MTRGGNRRLERINHLIREEISEYLQRDLNDPRIAGLVSVTDVETTADLAHAKVYISVLGEPAGAASTLASLQGAAGYIRSRLASRLSTRTVPKLDFRLDDSLERGARILELLREVSPS